jgi:hypothetical protein
VKDAGRPNSRTPSTTKYAANAATPSASGLNTSIHSAVVHFAAVRKCLVIARL